MLKVSPRLKRLFTVNWNESYQLLPNGAPAGFIKPLY